MTGAEGDSMARILHNYFRSSASYRVRIALGLKNLPYEYAPVHLNRNGGEQFAEPFLHMNPQALVPVLDDEGLQTSQSLAIMEYLEERYPTPALLPLDLADRAYVRRIAAHIACDIHPLNNLRVLKFLTSRLQVAEAAKSEWIGHWITTGLTALERELGQSGRSGRFCLGDTPTIADCCLVPQVFSARRFNIDLSRFSTVVAIDAACSEVEAFRLADPGAQPDSE
jgi:maleylpyruvate isomerase